MSEKKVSFFIPITIILAAFLYLEFSLFLAYGQSIYATIEADEAIDMGDLAFVLTSFITLVLSVINYLLISINCLTNKDELSFKKIIALLTAVVLVLFFVQIFFGLIIFFHII